jgi:hypothetical protein
VFRPGGSTSPAIRALQLTRLIAVYDADEYLLELRFDEASRGTADLRPELPLTLRW